MNRINNQILSYLDNFDQRRKKTYKWIEDYIKESREENVHEVRKSIRRLEAYFSILPKKVRQKPKVKQLIKLHRKFFKQNNVLRDYDVIEKKLSKFPQIIEINDILTKLRKKKKSGIKKSLQDAFKLQKIEIPNLSEKDLSEEKILKRFDKVTLDLFEKIQKNLPIVISDEKRIEELHELRKDCKKLRYILEIPIKGDHSRLLLILKQLQDVLGNIHDNDITINFLKNHKNKNNLKIVYDEQLSERMQNYRDFTNLINSNKISLFE